MSDGRGAILACPACRGPMREHPVGDEAALIDVCEQCRGVWFDWWDGESSGLLAQLPSHDGTRAGRSGGPCPRDGAPLFAHPYLERGPMVERCPSCFGLFAPAAQLEPLRQFHARMPEGDENRHPATLLERFWHAFGG